MQERNWPGEGRSIVLLHGLLASGDDWRGLTGALPHRCLAVDLPGFGGSDPPTHPRFSVYAEDVAEAFEQLRLGAVTLVGHSLGGGVATALAERMREQASSLVLLAPRPVRGGTLLTQRSNTPPSDRWEDTKRLHAGSAASAA